MTTYVVSRHTGAVEWVRRRLRDAGPLQVLAHVDEDLAFCPGDRVCGVLPLSMAARICMQGAAPLVIDLKVPQEMRGRELSADELDALGARLVQYEVRELSSH